MLFPSRRFDKPKKLLNNDEFEEYEDSSVESDYDDLGNKKKGNKNNYSNNSPYGGSNTYGSAYGDPHFMVSFIYFRVL